MTGVHCVCTLRLLVLLCSSLRKRRVIATFVTATLLCSPPVTIPHTQFKTQKAAGDDDDDDRKGNQFIDHLKKPNEANSEFSRTKTIAQQRRALPVYQVREELLQVSGCVLCCVLRVVCCVLCGAGRAGGAQYGAAGELLCVVCCEAGGAWLEIAYTIPAGSCLPRHAVTKECLFNMSRAP